MYADTWHTVNIHRLPNPPETLYRVGHSGNRNNVFSSRAAPQFEGHYDFVHVKKLHANWRNRSPTPFLSTFVHYNHAYNWAAQRKREKGDHSVRIHEITTNGLLVFGAGGGEYLVLDEIPDHNVVKTYSVQDDESDYESSDDDYYYN